MELTVRVKEKETGVITLLPNGIIDSDTSVLLDNEITRIFQTSIKTLVIDMLNVKLISSAGIGVIFKAKTTATRKDADFAMINLQPQVAKVFEIMRLLPTLNVFESVEELDEYLGKVQRKITDGDLEF